jgi:hypothetical protein
MAPPVACTGASASPSSATLPSVDTSGSKYMISAVRNAPMRAIDTKNVSTDSVLVTLIPANAAQPKEDSGGFQVRSYTGQGIEIIKIIINRGLC